MEEVTDPGSEEAGVLWLAVTQGGRGANTREKTSLLACVGEAQPGQLEAYLRPALARVRKTQPGSKLLLASSRPASDSLVSQLGLIVHRRSPGLALVADIAKEEIQVEIHPSTILHPKFLVRGFKISESSLDFKKRYYPILFWCFFSFFSYNFFPKK